MFARSLLRSLEYDKLRDVMIKEMGKAEDDSFPKLPDEDLLIRFHDCKSSPTSPVIFVPGTCGDVARKKREVTGNAGRPHRREAAETLEEVEERSYGSRLRYECGLARRFVDPETGGHYLDRWMQVGEDAGGRITMCCSVPGTTAGPPPTVWTPATGSSASTRHRHR